MPRTIDCWSQLDASIELGRAKRRLFVGVAAVCLSEGGVQHVFLTSEEALVALELVAKTLRISRRPLLCSSNFASFCCCNTKGLSSREAARGHATNVDGEMLSVTINRIYNY